MKLLLSGLYPLSLIFLKHSTLKKYFYFWITVENNSNYKKPVFLSNPLCQINHCIKKGVAKKTPQKQGLIVMTLDFLYFAVLHAIQTKLTKY